MQLFDNELVCSSYCAERTNARVSLQENIIFPMDFCRNPLWLLPACLLKRSARSLMQLRYRASEVAPSNNIKLTVSREGVTELSLLVDLYFYCGNFACQDLHFKIFRKIKSLGSLWSVNAKFKLLIQVIS